MRNNKDKGKGDLLKFTPTCHNNHIHNNITYREKVETCQQFSNQTPSRKMKNDSPSGPIALGPNITGEYTELVGVH